MLADRRWKHQPLADGDLAARPHQRAPLVFARRLGQHHFNAAGWLLPFAHQCAPRIRRAGITRLSFSTSRSPARRQRARTRKRVISQRARSHDPSPACGSCRVRGRLLRNQLFRQVVIEVVDTLFRTFAFWSSMFRHWISRSVRAPAAARAQLPRSAPRASVQSRSGARSAGTVGPTRPAHHNARERPGHKESIP